MDDGVLGNLSLCIWRNLVGEPIFERFVMWDFFFLSEIIRMSSDCCFFPCEQVEEDEEAEENEEDENDENEEPGGEENLRLWEKFHYHEFLIPAITWNESRADC